MRGKDYCANSLEKAFYGLLFYFNYINNDKIFVIICQFHITLFLFFPHKAIEMLSQESIFFACGFKVYLKLLQR